MDGPYGDWVCEEKELPVAPGGSERHVCLHGLLRRETMATSVPLPAHVTKIQHIVRIPRSDDKLIASFLSLPSLIKKT